MQLFCKGICDMPDSKDIAMQLIYKDIYNVSVLQRQIAVSRVLWYKYCIRVVKSNGYKCLEVESLVQNGIRSRVLFHECRT